MKTFNYISAIVFGLFFVVAIWAAQHNSFHYGTAVACAIITAASLVSDEGDGSIINDIKKIKR